MEKSLNFYNNFDKKLIDDYVLGNPRIERGILTLSSFIPENAKSILEIGCGIGWSSYEFSNCFRDAKINGIDLSPVLIKTAEKLFQNDNLTFEVFDVTKELPINKYDAVVMIDVYEHIPRENRNAFNKSLALLMNNQGRLIIACPTKYHQKWLKENYPEGLQPVDEDIDSQVVLEIAKDIKGEVVYYSYQNIWNSFDYLYAVIEINPQYGSKNQLVCNTNIILENKDLRIERVNKKLNLNYPKFKRENSIANLVKNIVSFKKFLR
jgi:SAM-dependent methyltransferase